MIFKKKVKEKQVIQQEPVDVNPMQQLAEETEKAIPEPATVPVPTPEEMYAPGTIPAAPVPGEPITTQERWEVGEVATQTERVLKDNVTGKAYDIYSAIALILNKAYQE